MFRAAKLSAENVLFGTSMFRWLPAKASITGNFYLFYTAVPANWVKIQDVLFSEDKITVQSSTGSLSL